MSMYEDVCRSMGMTPDEVHRLGEAIRPHVCRNGGVYQDRRPESLNRQWRADAQRARDKFMRGGGDS